MRRPIFFGFAMAFLAASFAACTMDFGQFQAGGGGNGGNGGTGGTAACNGGCCTALDCAAPQDPCKRATCIANTCGEEARADGTAIDAQTTGDCKRAVCQGGAVAQANDDGDTLDDMNDCTTDTCSNGSPTTSPTGPGTMCNSDGGKVCDGAGACVACNGNGDCEAAAPICDLATHTCIPATCSDNQQNGNETDTDCGGGQCPGCDTGQNCDVDTDCLSLHCGGGGHCAAPTCNDNIQNGDETDQDCGGPDCDGCGPGQGCDVNGDCAGNQCTGANGTCVPNCNDQVTNGAETDTDCGGGTCDPCQIGQSCAGQHSNCASNYCDATDHCAAKSPIGSMCTVDVQCSSGHCADGVCCNTTCAGTCQACDVAGSAGTCSPVPIGTDPASECAGNDVCNGAGACVAPKANGGTCTVGGECQSTFCVDGVCCDVACGGLCKACNLAPMGTCSNIAAGQDPANECAGAQTCDGNGACQ